MGDANLWVKKCRNCGQIYRGTRAFLNRECRTCENCGDDLPPARIDNETVNGSQPDGSSDCNTLDGHVRSDNLGDATHTRTCQSCGNVMKGTLKELEAIGGYCPSCGDFLGPAVKLSTLSANIRTNNVSNSENTQTTQVEGSTASGYVLRLVGTDAFESLPINGSGNGGMFGRYTAVNPTFATMRTLSRQQFAYRYVEGVLEIKNLSRYGMSVNGKRLLSNSDVIRVKDGATVEMAGQVFEIIRKGM